MTGLTCRHGKFLIASTLLIFCLVTSAPTLAQEAAGVAAEAGRPSIPLIWWLAPIGGIFALIMARVYYGQVMAADEGDARMQEIAGYVRDGAMAYLRRQYKVVAIVFVVLMALLAFMAFVLHVQHKIVPIAFLTGGFFSGLCGYLGMWTATNAAHRTTAGARRSLNEGLVVAFRAGAVMGLVVVGFALVDITGWFLGLYYLTSEMTLNEITVVMLTFGMGASTQALFARVGGGIYTKAADVGADLVGKVEAGIPEDDPRNAAAIADNVGDNVGDVAGMGADLYESYAGSILATAALGVAAASALAAGVEGALRMLSVPMIIAGVGIFLSVFLGIQIVKTKEGASMAELMAALFRGIYVSSVGIAILTYPICYFLLGDVAGVTWWGVATAVTVGLVAGVIIGKSTEYYTSYDFQPTRNIAEQAKAGPATVIIAGVAEGMLSTWASLLTVIVAILVSFYVAGGGQEFLLGLYGVGIAAVGMLSTLGMTLATDAYGPIADNAGGNAQMTEQAPHVRERTDALDSLGNTTAATGKGFAIGSAALTALALLAAYIEEVRVGQQREAMTYVNTHVEGAKGSAAGGVGEVIYLGYGKFGEKFTSGTSESCYRGYMLLNHEKVGAHLVAKDQFPVTALSAQNPEDDFIQVTRVRGHDGQEHELHLVTTRRASIAQYMRFYDVTLMNPQVLCGVFAGVMMVFVFCALTMKAVGRAAYAMMFECRRQFDKLREYARGQGKSEQEANDPANWPMSPVDVGGERYPDYANCVRISTAGAQREMILPSLLAIAAPILIGLIFGVQGVMGLLVGGLTSGFAVAIFMANAGGAWDNAKKYIETGQHGGKGSEAHKAGVVGDTVGDPFKDTSGPSLNILIKLISMVSVVFAGLVVKYAPVIGELLGLG